jgi:TfoX/Sxy family transcriptional regulator of competence genes
LLAFDETQANRVRRLFFGREDVVEQKMMGSLVFMVQGHMCCGISEKGLMVRVGNEARALVDSVSHAQPMCVGDRTPTGFIRVEPAGFADDGRLSEWVKRGLDFVATLPAKKAKAKSKRALMIANRLK